MPNFETRLKDVSHAAWLIWTANGRRPKRDSMIGSLTSGAIFSAIWCKRSTLLKKRKSRRPCENSMRGSVRSRREPIFAIFSALRGYRPRNLGTAQRVAEFSHGLLGFCTCSKRDTLEGGKEHC